MSFPPPTPQQVRILWMSVTALAVAVFLGLLGLLLWGIGWLVQELSSVLLPLAIAGIIAYLLDPVVDYFERKKIPRASAILLVFALALLLVLGMAATVVPQLVRETQSLAGKMPDYAKRLEKRVDELIRKPPLGIQVPDFINRLWRGANAIPNLTATNLPATETTVTNLLRPPDAVTRLPGTNDPPAGDETKNPGFLDTEWGGKALAWLADAMPAIWIWLKAQLSKAASLAGLLIGLALVPIYTFYFLAEKRGIEQNWSDYLPFRESRTKDEAVFVIRAINQYLILFFRGQVLVALCDGALLTIGFLILGLNYAFLLGMVAGLLSIVPYLGVAISLIPALGLAAVQFGTWLHPLLVLGIFGLVQLAEGLYISPKIMGNRVGLHPLTIIVAVMVGTTLMGGIIGGILAIPLTAALRVVMFRYIWRRPAEPKIIIRTSR